MLYLLGVVEPICYGNHWLVDDNFYNLLNLNDYDNYLSSYGYVFSEDFYFCKKCYLNELLFIDQHLMNNDFYSYIRFMLIIESFNLESVGINRLYYLEDIIISSNEWSYGVLNNYISFYPNKLLDYDYRMIMECYFNTMQTDFLLRFNNFLWEFDSFLCVILNSVVILLTIIFVYLIEKKYNKIFSFIIFIAYDKPNELVNHSYFERMWRSFRALVYLGYLFCLRLSNLEYVYEFESLFESDLIHKAFNVRLQSIFVFFYSNLWINYWEDSLLYWRTCSRVLYMLFLLPFVCIIYLIISFVLFYLDVFGFIVYLLYCFLKCFYHFKLIIAPKVGYFLSRKVFFILNWLAYFSFFGPNYLLIAGFYSCLPHKFHLLDPTTYEDRYPARPHPWAAPLFRSFFPIYFPSLKIYNPFKGVLLRIFSSTLPLLIIEMILNFTDYVLQIGNLKLKTNVYLIELNLLVYSLAVWVKESLLNNILFILFIIMLLFLKYYLFFIVVFCFIFIFIFINLYKYSLKAILYFLDLFFFSLGWLFFLPFRIIAFILRFIIYVIIHFDFYIVCLVLFYLCCYLHLETFRLLFIRDFIELNIWGPYSQYIYQGMMSLAWLNNTWKWALLNNADTGVYTAAVGNINLRILDAQIAHYTTHFFSDGLFRFWFLVRLWWNFHPLFVERVETFKYLINAYIYGHFWYYIVYGPLGPLWIRMDYNSILLLEFTFVWHYLYHHLFLHILLYINVYLWYEIPNWIFMSDLREFYFETILPYVINIKSINYIDWCYSMIILWKIKYYLCYIFYSILFFMKDITTCVCIFNFYNNILDLVYEIIKFWFLIFYTFICELYTTILWDFIDPVWINILGWPQYFDSVQRDFLYYNTHLRYYGYPVESYFYYWDNFHSRTRLSPTKLDKLSTPRPLFLSQSNWELRILYIFRVYHGRRLEHNIWRFYTHGECYFDTSISNMLGLYKWHGWISDIAEIFSLFAKRGDILYIYNFNPHFALFYTFWNFFFVLPYIFLLYLFVMRGSYVHISPNPDYLWRMFREKEMDPDNNFKALDWVIDKANRDLLEYYTKKLVNLEFATPYEDLLSNEYAAITLAEMFNKFSIDQNKIVDTFYDTMAEDAITSESWFSKFTKKTYLQNKENKNKDKDKKKDFNKDMKKFFILIQKLAKERDDIGKSFSDSFLQDVTLSLSFDYAKLLTDQKYHNFFKNYIEISDIITVFISKGSFKDKLLYEINSCFYTTPLLLDLYDYKENKDGEIFWIKFMDFMWFVDTYLDRRLPRWSINKDANGVYVHSNSRSENKKDIYSIDCEGYSFELMFTFLFLIPWFLLVIFTNFFYKTVYKEIYNGMQYIIVYVKVYLINFLPVNFFTDFLRVTGYTSWDWMIHDEVTAGAAYPDDYVGISMNHFDAFLEYLDPLYKYDGVFKETILQTSPLNDKFDNFKNVNVYSFLVLVYDLILNFILVLWDYIHPYYVSDFFFYFDCLHFFIFVCLVFRYIKMRREFVLKKRRPFNKRLFIYIQKIYNIKLMKMNNYIKKLHGLNNKT